MCGRSPVPLRSAIACHAAMFRSMRPMSTMSAGVGTSATAIPGSTSVMHPSSSVVHSILTPCIGTPGGEPGRAAAAAPERRDGLAGRAQPAQLALDVVDAEADVVQPVAVLGHPPRQRVVRVERLDQLQIGVAEIEVGQPHRHLGRLVHRHHREPEPVAEVQERGLGVGNRDGDMVEAADHRGGTVAAARGPIAATTSASRPGPPTLPGTTT